MVRNRVTADTYSHSSCLHPTSQNAQSSREDARAIYSWPWSKTEPINPCSRILSLSSTLARCRERNTILEYLLRCNYWAVEGCKSIWNKLTLFFPFPIPQSFVYSHHFPSSSSLDPFIFLHLYHHQLECEHHADPGLRSCERQAQFAHDFLFGSI